MQENIFENKTYYRTNTFKTDRPTLVFIHGVSGSSSAWLPYEKIFENTYNVLTYDIRGHGKSKKFRNYYDYEINNFVEDLHDLITHLNIKEFILISNSFGSLIAIEYIKSYRHELKAVVFTSPEVYLGTGLMGKILQTVFKIMISVINLFPFNPRPRGHVDYNKHLGSTDWDIKRNLADMINTTPRVHFYTLRHSLPISPDYSLESINIPTLIIHGEKDTMVPLKNALLMKNQVKNSEFKSIANIDHNTVHNAVKEMSEAIESFIQKHKDNF